MAKAKISEVTRCHSVHRAEPGDTLSEGSTSLLVVLELVFGDQTIPDVDSPENGGACFASY
jgi:hypothetical protein